ncbi:MAG: hypothetical protein ACHQX3_06560 [Nitrospirales bacterium]|jgi:hypothetical protein
MNEEATATSDSSYVGFERTAKGVIVPRVKVVSGDSDKATMDEVLARAKALFAAALEYAEENGARP